jgi:O-antigen ligase
MYFSLMILSKKKVFALLLVLGVVSAPIVLPEVVVKRISYTFTQKTQAGQKQIGDVKIDTSTSARLQSWKDSYNAFLERPVFGHGVTGWGFLDAQYMKVLVETGVLGLFSFAALLWVILKEGWRSFKNVNSDFCRAISLALIASFIGMLFHSLSANTFIIVRIMEPFWFLVGLVVVARDVDSKDADEINAAEIDYKEQLPGITK